jgi:NAD(P)-dependent dehydrogenase (short-subunit alcohol dehydrogenase family)
MVEIHHLGTVYVTKAAWPHMTAAGYGRIVNTTSEGAIGIVPKNRATGPPRAQCSDSRAAPRSTGFATAFWSTRSYRGPTPE